MIKKPFRFQDPKESEKELRELGQARQESEAALVAVGDRARLCLSLEDFKAYRDDYRRTEAKLIDYLLKYNQYFHKNPGEDITLYAMKVSTILTRLEAVRSLLSVISNDAQKGMKKKT